jgi:hypothetical protein
MLHSQTFATKSNPSDLDKAVDDFNMTELEAGIAKLPPGAEHDYYAGILAHDKADFARSITLLTAALPTVRESQRDHAVTALYELIDDYQSTYQYSLASASYDDLLHNFSDQLHSSTLVGAQNSAELMHLMRNLPPLSITWNGTSRLNIKQDGIRFMYVNLTVNGVTAPWLLDASTDIPMMSQSFAIKLGMKVYPQIAHINSGIAKTHPSVHIGLIPKLEIGSATLNNVPVMVMNDKDMELAFHQINASLSYAIFRELGVTKFIHNKVLVLGEAPQTNSSTVPLYNDSQTPVIQVTIKGKTLPFTLNLTATNSSFLTRYFNQFQAESSDWSQSRIKESYVGANKKWTIYKEHNLDVKFGDYAIQLKNTHIYNDTPANSSTYGYIGQDILRQMPGYIWDLKNMTFTVLNAGSG